MKSAKKEFWVGCMVLFALLLTIVFGYWMRVIGPFRSEVRFFIDYDFAGGIDVGSPVRVSGIKVGKVESIDFLSPDSSQAQPASLRVTISVAKNSAGLVRQDSKFFINMAGIIGEHYLEISPGSVASPVLALGSHVRGTDPPRMDQLLSQGYGVFGRLQEFLENNEEQLTRFIKQMNGVLTDMNKMFKGDDKGKFIDLVDNMSQLSADLSWLVKKLQTEDSQQTFANLRDMIKKAHEIDNAALKRFFQDEGIRAKIF